MKDNTPKIFELDYLAKEDLTENDLYFLFETKSLICSLISAMFRATGEYTSFKKIYKDIKHDNGWLNDRHFRSKREYNEFYEQCVAAIKNIYQYSDYLSRRWMDDFMFHYGFTIKKK